MNYPIITLPLGPIQTNCYLVADAAAQTAVVIDPGAEAGRVLAALQQHRWTATHVLLTHAHFDHIGAAAEVAAATGAPLAIHRLELPLLRAKGGAPLFGMDIPACPEPGLLVEPGQTVTCGALTFQVLFVPGHTVGHVAYYCAPAGAVFSGDVLFQDSIGRTDLPGGDYATLLRSIRETLFTLPPATHVYPGHGPATTLGAEQHANPFLAD